MNASPLCGLLARQAREQGARVAVVSEAEGLSLSFAEVALHVERWAGRLDEIGAGNVVALAVGNSVAFVELVFALRARGAILLAIDASHSPAAVAGQVGARWLLWRHEGREVGDGVRLLRVGDGRALPEGAAFVKLTSANTVSPRGAIFTEDALVEGVGHIRDGMALTHNDVVLITIPLSHSYGFDSGVLSLAAIGTPLVIQPDVVPAAVRATIAKHGVTFWPAVPALLRAISAGTSSGNGSHALKRIISASAPLSREVADAVVAALGVRVQEFFGATEAGGIAFETRPADPDAGGTVGLPMPGVRIEIVDGCVRVHSKANRFAMVSEGGVETSPSYVDTGDRASFTPAGRIVLLGRTVHIANVGGVKVDLAAIETFFRGVPGVSDAAALAVADAARGECVVVCVETLARTRDELRALVKQELTAREVPRDIRVVPCLPRTERGKVDRIALEGIVRV